jgi:uncharacterized membrane protein YdjX (TVP38/TMEM64 family)
VPVSIGLVGIGLGSYVWMTSLGILSPLVVVNQLISFLRTSSYSPLLYTLVYTIRPLILFPASLLTIAGGMLFGPVWGTIYTIVGSNASALVAYSIGRYVEQYRLESEQSESMMAHYAQRMRQKPFETVLIMRCVFLPYDLVNYLAGFLRIDWKPFLLATALGSLPGTLVFVLAGSAIEGQAIRGVPRLNLSTLAASGAILVGSLALSRLFKQHEAEVDDMAECYNVETIA